MWRSADGQFNRLGAKVRYAVWDFFAHVQRIVLDDIAVFERSTGAGSSISAGGVRHSGVSRVAGHIAQP